MKILTKQDLPQLPLEVKSLVADGIYSLYQISSNLHPAARYALFTERKSHYYLLTEDGVIVTMGENDSLVLASPISAISFDESVHDPNHPRIVL